VSYLHEMVSWGEGGAGQARRGQVVWYDQTWAHRLHSFFILLNAFCAVLSFELRRAEALSPSHPEIEDTEASQLSQLSQRSEASTVSTASQSLREQKKKKKGKKLRKKRKREEDGAEEKKVLEDASAARGRLFADLLASALEFKTFCRKSRVGSLYEVSALLDPY
jgi:hypothetical protein